MPLLRGDLNNDSSIDINDIVILINTVLGRSIEDGYAQITTGYVEYSADLNNDTKIDINDIVILINTVLGRKEEDGYAQILPAEDPTTGGRVDPPESTSVQYQNSASLIAVLNDSDHYVKEGDVIAAYDLTGEIISYESLRVAKNDPPLPNEPHLATITMNSVVSRQYSYQQDSFALIIALDNLGVTGGVVTYSIPSGQSISGSTEIISNIRQLTYTPPVSYTGGYIFNDSFTYRVTNGTTTKEASIALSIEPKYYFGGNMGLETNLTGVTYKYWDSDQRKTHDLVYSFGDNPANVAVDSLLGNPIAPVEFVITQSARKKFRTNVYRTNKVSGMFPVRKKVD